MPVDHYENFPVASFLLPARLRPAVEAIYAFARSADDIADEGDALPAQRLADLGDYEAALGRIEQRASSKQQQGGQPQIIETGLFNNLIKVIQDYQLPLPPFYDLLSAFKQDVATTRYATFALLMDYCRRSANPVGCLMLHLYGAANAPNLRDSDAICSALQLINFWQDVAIDWQKQRIYLPQEDINRFNVTEQQLDTGQIDAAWRGLMAFQVTRARTLMQSGAPLALRLPGRIGWELRMVVQGGLRILERIEAADYDVFRHRPQLRLGDWARILWRTIWMARKAKS